MTALKKRGRDPLKFLDGALAKWSGKDKMKTFSLKEINRMQTLDYIRKLGNSTAHGIDGLDALSLKVAAEDLCDPLTHIINSSIKTRTFATRWKMSRIIPHLKAKDVSKIEPSSYRPVALLPTTSKLIERAIQSQLQKHLEQEGLLNHNSHAYRTHHSTATAMLQLTERLYTATDKNLVSQLLAIDQSSAFDCVNHGILSLKLKRYGCDRETLQWMSSYLGNRSQFTNIGRHNSSIRTTNRGVPQGSILGPLLFLVYTNEMSEVIIDPDCEDPAHSQNKKLFGENCRKCGQVVSYADDTTYQIDNKLRCQNQVKINKNLIKFEEFLTDNDLVVNMGKTSIKECMIKQKKGRLGGTPPQLVITTPQGTLKELKDSKNFRVLGANIQQNMGWSRHLETGDKAVFPKVRRQFGAMKMLGKQLPRESKKLLAEGFPDK